MIDLDNQFVSTLTTNQPKVGKPARRRRRRGLRDRTGRHAFRPGVEHGALERLEARRLLDGSQDLTAAIKGFLDGGATSGNQTLTNVTVGSFLTVPSVTVSWDNVQETGSDWTGTVQVMASSANLAIGSGLTGSIQGDANQANGLSGTYTLNNQPDNQGTYSLAAEQIAVADPSVFKATATAAEFTYQPGAAAGQTIFDLGNASATFTPLNNTAITLKDLEIRDNGFSLGDGTIAVASFTLGNILAVTNPSVSFQGVSYTECSTSTGTSSVALGTITVAADSATLFPGNSHFTAGVTGFSAAYDTAAGTLTTTASSANLAIGNILSGNSTGVTLTYDPTASSPLTVSAASINLTSPLFPGAAVTGTNLVANSAGFTLDKADLTDSEIKLGKVLDITNFDLGVTNLDYTTVPGGVLSGTITVATTTVGTTVGSVTLFPGQSAFTASLTNFHGSYDLGGGGLTLKADSASLSVGSILQATATSPTITWDGTNATVDLDSAKLTSSLFPGASATLSDLHADNTGFTIAQADLFDSEIKLGSVLDITNFDLGVTNLDYTAGPGGVLSGTITVATTTVGNTVGSVSILPGAKLFSTTVDGFSGSYDLTGHALTLKATDATITVGSVLVVTAKGLGFSLAPNTSGTDDVVSVSVVSATAALPQEGVAGSVTGLMINNDGFQIASASLTATDPTKPFSAFGGKFQITNPSATLTNFGYSVSAGAEFNSNLTLKADQIEIDPTTTFSVVATNLTTSIDFTTTNIGHFTFTAGTVNAQLGSLLTLQGLNIQFDSSPASPNQDIVDFGSLTATLTAGKQFSVTGTATNFGITAAGTLDQLANFGVSFNLTDTSKIQWPSWLPIQVTTFGLSWPNKDFSTDPTDFTLTLSASVNAAIPGTSVQLAGGVTGAVIDTNLLASGAFPITSLAGATIMASGKLFGLSLSGSIIVGILDTDASYNMVTDPTQAVHHIFYGGIEVTVAVAGVGGFEVRVGLSQLGPLDFFVSESVPIILDPENGLALTNLNGGIDFDQVLPSITTAKQLATDPAFDPPSTQTLGEWQTELMTQVATQAKVDQGSVNYNVFQQSMKIDAGATLYDEYASQNAFQIQGNILIDTTGKVEVSGQLLLGNQGVSKGAAYLDLSQVASGTATLLLYAQAPVATPLLTAYGKVQFQLGSDLNLDGKTTYGTVSNFTTATGASLLDNSPFTVEFSARQNAIKQAGTIFSTSNGNLLIGFNNSGYFTVTVGTKSYTPSSVTDTAWHSWAVTLGSGTLTIYEDGSLVRSWSGVAQLSNSGANLLLGVAGSSSGTIAPGSYFAGSVDAVRVWDKALAATTIAGYDVGVKPTAFVAPTAGLIGEWTFFSGSEVVAADLSNSGHPLVISGSPVWTTATGAPASPFTQIDALGHPVADGLEIILQGEVDLVVPDVPAGVQILGDATFQANIVSTAFDLTVTGTAPILPLGQVTLAGDVHFAIANNAPILYGALDITGSIPQLASLGLSITGTTVLEFNTTNVNQAEVLLLPSGVTTSPFILAPQSVSLLVNGDLGINDVLTIDGTLYAQFTVHTLPSGKLDPELDIAVSGTVAIGPTSAPVVTFSVSGFLLVDSAGLAASLNLSLDDSSVLAKYGITINTATLGLVVNTTGQAQSFTVPTLTDPTTGLPFAGSGTPYTVPAAPDVADPPAAGTYLLVTASGDLTINNFDLNGSFDILVTPSLFRVDLNDMALSYTEKDGTKLFSLTAQGGLLLESDGFAGAIEIGTGQPIEGNDFQLNANFTFAVNTTDSDQSPGGIDIAANTVSLDATGDLLVGASGSQFDISGTVDITVSAGSLALAVTGTADLGVLGTITTTNSLLTVTDQGLYGELNLGAAVRPFNGFAFNGDFDLQFNTTGANVTDANGVLLQAGVVRLDVTNAELQVAGAFDLTGEFDLTVNDTGFQIVASADLNLLGVKLDLGNVFAAIKEDSSGNAQFALYAGLTPDPKGGKLLSGTGYAITVGTMFIEVNTGAAAVSTNAPAGSTIPASIPGDTVRAEIDNANVNAFGFTATGTLIATASNGGIDIQVPQNNPLTLSFLKFGSIQAYGDFNSNGTFSLTATASYDVSVSPVELVGSIQVSISNTGFSAGFTGSAELDLGSLGTYNIASAAANFSVVGTDVHLMASFRVASHPYGFDVDYGAAPKPPAGTPGLALYSVPQTVAAGSSVTVSAVINDSSGNPIANGNYDWSTTPSDPNATTPYSPSYTFNAGVPGTDVASLYQVVNGSDVLIRRTNITVVDQAPTIAYLNVNPIYLVDGTTPVTIDPSIATPIDTSQYPLTYTYTVLKNGQPFRTSTFTSADPTYSFTPDAVGTNPPLDKYQVTLAVTDPFGGKTTTTGYFTSFDPNNITVNSLADIPESEVSSPNTFITLREAVDLIDSEPLVTGITPTIHFDPSLAGGTIALVYQNTLYGSNSIGASALSIIHPMVIDASEAPGLTITIATTNPITNVPVAPMRVFNTSVDGQNANFGLFLHDINIVGGSAIGDGEAADGGAIYVGENTFVDAIDVALLNNKAQETSSNSGGFGGAVYVADYAEFLGHNVTIANNQALADSSYPDSRGGDSYGGAIYSNGNVNLDEATIVNNTGLVTIGVYDTGGLVLDNSIVAQNSDSLKGQANDPFKEIVTSTSTYGTSGTNNLYGTSMLNSEVVTLAASLKNVTQVPLLLGALLPRDNGVDCYSLLPNSPAINAGDPNDIEDYDVLDSRGMPRVVGGMIDLGAFEHQPYVVTNTNTSGPGSLADAVASDDDDEPIILDLGTLGSRTIFLAVPLVIQSNITITGPGANLLTISGGGMTQILQNPGFTVTITGVNLANGSGVLGGAIFNEGNLTLDRVALIDNQSNAFFGSIAGGAIYNHGSLTLTNDLFAGNTAGLATQNNSNTYSAYGGAIYNDANGTLTASNDTFTGNSAGVAGAVEGEAGAIANLGTAQITACTFADNAVYDNIDGTTDLFNDESSVTLTNSILADPIGGVDVNNLFGTLTGSNNLIMASYGVDAGVILSTADPLLRPLGNYGGSTETMALTAGSPAIGQATLNGSTTDQRGKARTPYGPQDLGAFQLEYYSVTNGNDSGLGSLRQAILDDVDLSPITLSAAVGTIDLTSGPIVLDHDLTIVGAGANSVVISGGGTKQLFEIGAGATVSLSGMTLRDGVAQQGGAINNAGTLLIDGVDFWNDQAQGILGSGSTPQGLGGAINNAPTGRLTITDSTFGFNVALGAKGSSVFGSAADGRGGAIENQAGGQLTLANDTFTNNTAQGGAGYFGGKGGYGSGGAIDDQGVAQIVNVTIDGNTTKNGAGAFASSTQGGAILVASGATLTLYNTIAADSTGSDDIDNFGTTTGGGNLVMTYSGLVLKNGAGQNNGLVVTTADPLLAGLNSSAVMLPEANSPVFGEGVVAVAASLDQQGLTRVVGGVVDIGATQLQVAPATPSAGGPYTIHSDHDLNLKATTVNPSNSPLTYSWTFIGVFGVVYISQPSSSATLSLKSDDLPNLGLLPGTYTVQVQVSDGYGGAHTVTSAPVAVTIAPALVVTSQTPAISGSVNTPFDSVTFTTSDPLNLKQIPAGSLVRLTLNGGGGLDSSRLTIAAVAGQANTYRISGLATLTKLPGTYALTINGDLLVDAIGPGSNIKTTTTWLLDTTAPTSMVNPLPASTTGTTITVSVTGTDPLVAGAASGVASYDLFVAVDGGAFAYWTTVPGNNPSAVYTVPAQGHSYAFQSFANDAAGNREMKPTALEAGTYVPITLAPEAHVTAVDSSESTFTVAFAQSANGNPTLSYIDLFVRVDGGPATQFAQVTTASGSVTYGAIQDGTIHSYAFYALATDPNGHTQAVPTAADVTVSASFAPPTGMANAPVSLSVDHGAVGRSFVRYVDLDFSSNVGLANLINGGHIHLIKHDLIGQGATPIDLSGVLHIVDNAIEFDFGARGLGGNPDSTAGDGYYEIDVDGQSQPFYFDRLFGDVNGDGTVDNTDIALITSVMGSPSGSTTVDVDGSGTVTAADRTLVQRAKGHALGAGLHLDA